MGKCGFYFNRWDRTADVEVLPEPTIFGISRTNSEGDITVIEKHDAVNNEGDSNYQLQATMMEYSQRKGGVTRRPK